MAKPPTFLEAFSEVLAHAALVYESHNRKKKDTWKDMSLMGLEKGIKRELKEYSKALTITKRFEESLDVLNYALMFATRCLELVK